MMSCKTTALMLSSDADLTRWARLSLTMHLAMCRHCRAFAKQLHRFSVVALRTSRNVEAEPSPDFEARIVSRILH